MPVDPISIAGLVIALIQATREIQKSIDKVPRNRKNVRKLMSDIADFVNKLKEHCEKHVLDESPEMHLALSDLLERMGEVGLLCRNLVVPRAKGRFNKMRAAFKAWLTCDLIETMIEELKDKAQAATDRFLVFTLIRIEGPIHGIASTIVRIEEPIHGMASAIPRIEQKLENFVADFQTRTPSCARSSQIVTTITTSTAQTMEVSSTPPGQLYLQEQLKVIVSTLGTLSTAPSLGREDPYGLYMKPFTSVIPHRLVMNHQTSAACHREVIAATLGIINILQGPSGEAIIQNGAWEMVNLAIRLYHLGMYSDAETIGILTVDLYKALSSANTRVYEPYLALALRNLSEYKMKTDDYQGATKAIEDCVVMEREMLDKICRYRVHLELSNSLLRMWEVFTRDGNFEKGLKVAQESLELLDRIRAELGEWGPYASDESSSAETFVDEAIGDAIPQPVNSNQEWDYVSTLWLELNTAQACHSLSFSLEDTGQICDAYNNELRALTIYRGLYHEYPGIYDEKLARCLAHISSTPLANDIPPLISLRYKQESNHLFRALAASHPAKFTAPFKESLWQYATLLHDTGNFEAAEQCSYEALELIRKSNNDRILLANALQDSSRNLLRIKQNKTVITIKREVIEIYRQLSTNSTAELGPTIIADQLCDLAFDHIRAGQNDYAVSACREAIQYYRSVLPPEDSGNLHSAGLARALSALTHALNVTQQYSQALSTGSEALALYQRLFVNDRGLIEPYLSALKRVGAAACHVDDTNAIKIHSDVVQAFRVLADSSPDHVKWGLVDALHDHNYMLVKYQRTHESRHITEELVNYFRDIPLESAEVSLRYMAALTNHAESYAELGRIGEALLLCKRAIAIGQEFATTADDSENSLGLANALSTYSEYLRYIGRYDEALPASKATLEIFPRHSQDNKLMLACRLHEYSINLQHAKRLPEAIAAAEEAVGLCRSSSSATFLDKMKLPHVLETLSSALVEAGDKDRAFETILEAINLFQEIRSNPSTAEPWSYAETLYANALVNISFQYASRGNWKYAEATISEAIAIFKTRVISASIYYPPLARALDFAVIQFCASGNHREAKAAAQDLHERKHYLESIDPEVAMLVRVALAEIAGRPSQSILRQKYLECTRCSFVQA
ncbi:hypothetical protein BDZ94DRAFT_1305685 [Collybia nuda]|uniref:Anaphase-promoting complex subunit 5 domain-containing protein n=1 Tax=Collybia nuda TaxID=64659 RepID=A0A9P5YBT4_9AGAR|nr:hypothetical protein BDZ94DRAFT_1305685 [Collybia nuda]